jgi:hypothetical protein
VNFRVRVRVRVTNRIRVRVRLKMRVWVKVRIGVEVRFRMRGRVRVRVRLRLRCVRTSIEAMVSINWTRPPLTTNDFLRARLGATFDSSLTTCSDWSILCIRALL